MNQRLDYSVSIIREETVADKNYLVIFLDKAFQLTASSFHDAITYLQENFHNKLTEGFSITDITKQGLLMALNVKDTNMLIEKIQNTISGINNFQE
ncbi:hypothetical protein ABC345_00915 [Shouchella sp. 1P09AA]|uniref:hypothetical protein n=1 Tax=unclassified Shouchella TaxID=2893065 RepID=UPI00399EFC3A